MLASARGLAANVAFFALAAMISTVPDPWIVLVVDHFPGNLNMHGDLSTVRMCVWVVCTLAAAVCDLVVHYHPVHDASDKFKDSTWFCRSMATKILSLDTRGADHDKEWAKGTLEDIRVTSIGGFLVQLVLGLPLFVICSLAPWVVGFLVLPVNPWPVTWFILVKVPGMSLAVAELSSTAFHTWYLKLRA